VKLDGNHLIDVLDGKDRPLPTYPELETVDGLRKNKHAESPTRARFRATLPMLILGLVAVAIISVGRLYDLAGSSRNGNHSRK
jgi:hypothetical protein